MTDIEKNIVEDFNLFDEWEEKYQYIIELGQKLPPLNPEHRTEENKIKGCQSNVWLHSYTNNNLIYFVADSDSTFVKGEIALLIQVLNGLTADQILAHQLEFIDVIGLKQHLAMTRANGLASMIKQMKAYAMANKITTQS
ncbi:MAG: hypothetical protein RIQ89_2182 [Bacteroidota bacterium]|jgi:cysteine desulfuration protein SufE